MRAPHISTCSPLGERPPRARSARAARARSGGFSGGSGQKAPPDAKIFRCAAAASQAPMGIDGGRGWLGDPGAGNPAHLQKKKSSMSFHLSIGTYINVEVIIRPPHPAPAPPLQARAHRGARTRTSPRRWSECSGRWSECFGRWSECFGRWSGCFGRWSGCFGRWSECSDSLGCLKEVRPRCKKAGPSSSWVSGTLWL